MINQAMGKRDEANPLTPGPSPTGGEGGKGFTAETQRARRIYNQAFIPRIVYPRVKTLG